MQEKLKEVLSDKVFAAELFRMEKPEDVQAALEKYYTLAQWANNHVEYDDDFWNGGYNLQSPENAMGQYNRIADIEKRLKEDK